MSTCKGCKASCSDIGNDSTWDGLCPFCVAEAWTAALVRNSVLEQDNTRLQALLTTCQLERSHMSEQLSALSDASADIAAIRTTGFSEAFTEIRRLVSVNAKHRKGFRLCEIEHHSFVVHQAADELRELNDAVDRYQNNITKTNGEVAEELADTLGVLFHLAIRFKFTSETLSRLMLDKFKERFTE